MVASRSASVAFAQLEFVMTSQRVQRADLLGQSLPGRGRLHRAGDKSKAEAAGAPAAAGS